jgi:hypothetical protein
LFVSLNARENPFFPAEGELDVPMTSNQTDKEPPLKRATITLPSTARTVESVSVEYKNLDGSIATKKIILKNSIDWHLPLFISQSYIDSEDSSRNKTKKKSLKKVTFRKIASLKFISFYENKKELKILTKDKMIRNFFLVKPHRIVCDFQREIDIRSFEKKSPKGSVFTKIRIGNHSGYYRVVIELDGYYKHKTKKIKNGYLFKLL